jgi:hypothetical protein
MVLFLQIGMAGDDNENEAQSEEDNAAYDNPTTLDEENLKFSMEQNVGGMGFFTAGKYAQMPDALGTEGR